MNTSFFSIGKSIINIRWLMSVCNKLPSIAFELDTYIVNLRYYDSDNICIYKKWYFKIIQV